MGFPKVWHFPQETASGTLTGPNGLKIELHSEGNREAANHPSHQINMQMELKIHRLFLAKC